MLDIYVHQTLLVLTTVKHVRQSASQTKKLNKKWINNKLSQKQSNTRNGVAPSYFILLNKKDFLLCCKGGKIWLFAQHPTCQLDECLCTIPYTWDFLVFFTILPYLVFTIFPPSFLCSLSNIVLEHSSSVCFPSMACIMVVYLCSSCIFFVIPLICYSFVCKCRWIFLIFEYDQGWHLVGLFLYVC